MLVCSKVSLLEKTIRTRKMQDTLVARDFFLPRQYRKKSATEAEAISSITQSLA